MFRQRRALSPAKSYEVVDGIRGDVQALSQVFGTYGPGTDNIQSYVSIFQCSHSVPNASTSSAMVTLVPRRVEDVHIMVGRCEKLLRKVLMALRPLPYFVFEPRRSKSGQASAFIRYYSPKEAEATCADSGSIYHHMSLPR